jgi:NADH-quinone oxidoreductase subunit G
MATILINGQEYQLPEGERLNAIQAAMRVGVEIPYYCWHPALSVVANCRMCEIEVGARDPKTGEIKMLPRLTPGCQTPAKDGTVLVTDSKKVQEHQQMIMEYLLINHPLDCPVCDQAGQCGLQDYSFTHGQAKHRFVEERIVNPNKEVSAQIQLNQDRCIMCTRCVRFAREITGTAELEVINRGGHAEIDIFPGRPLDNPLAGNVVDLCPVGALLDKDFLHKQRYWFLDRHETVCTRCATGCAMFTEENRGRVWRLRPRFNPHVNDYWMCDEGRASYKAANDLGLLSGMAVRRQDALVEVAVDEALEFAGTRLREICGAGGKMAGVISPFLTVEEAYLFGAYLKSLNPENVLGLGPIPSAGADQTFSPDPRRGRTGDTSFVVCRPFTIRAEKCPNRRGVEAILAHLQGEVISYESFVARAGQGEFKGVYATSDALDPSFAENEARVLRGHVEFLVVQDVHETPLSRVADAVLCGATFAEKAGSYVNALGRLQYAEAALPPRDGSLPDLDIFAALANRGPGPIESRVVLAELAEVVPAFAVARGGVVPEFGVVLGEPQTADDTTFPFADPWLAPQGRQSALLEHPLPKVEPAPVGST